MQQNSFTALHARGPWLLSVCTENSALAKKVYLLQVARAALVQKE